MAIPNRLAWREGSGPFLQHSKPGDSPNPESFDRNCGFQEQKNCGCSLDACWTSRAAGKFANHQKEKPSVRLTGCFATVRRIGFTVATTAAKAFDPNKFGPGQTARLTCLLESIANLVISLLPECALGVAKNERVMRASHLHLRCNGGGGGWPGGFKLATILPDSHSAVL